MKKFALIAASVSVMVITSIAGAQEYTEGFERPRPPMPPPGHGHNPMCVVSFKKCDFSIQGFCVKWNNKAYSIYRHEAYWACQRMQDQFGQIKNCSVQCN